jgi:hypothetical protein
MIELTPLLRSLRALRLVRALRVLRLVRALRVLRVLPRSRGSLGAAFAMMSAIVLVACSRPPPASRVETAGSVATSRPVGTTGSASPVGTTGSALPVGAAGSPWPAGALSRDTAAGRQLAWVLDVIARGGAVEAAALEAHFAPAFLAGRPIDKLAAAFAELAQHLARMTITRVAASDGAHIVLHGAASEGKFALAIGVDAATGRIAALEVGPEFAPPPASMAEAITRLRALAPQTQLLVAELDHGACTPRHAWNPTAELALGSAFKLYVLLGLADRIAAGAARWADELALRDDWKSLPSGITQDDPAGTRLSLRTLAERMISISDNTAADVLLYTVGRAAVEQAMRATHHAEPARNVPFLGTRELFWLKMAMPPAEVERYLALAPAPRRAVLDGLAGKRPSAAGFDAWIAPRWIDRIEWFASGEDLCRLAGALWQRAQAPGGAPVLDVLGKNPGAPASPAWPYIGFKGGSEPGVLNATWLLRRADGRWFVVTLGANAPHALDEGDLLGLGHGVIALVAAEP